MKWRRSDMTTTTSSSKPGRFRELYRDILHRNRGYLWLYSALVAVCYPLLFALEAFKRVDQAEAARIQAYAPETLAQNPMYFYSFEGLGCNFAGVSIVFFLMIALLAPMILALVLNSYMHSKKASDVYHAIPVSRGTLLTANAAVGMTIIGLPLAASNLFIMAVQIAKFGFLPDVTAYLWLDALGWMICGFAIYAVTTFVSVCVGTVFDTFVLSGTLLLAAPVLSALGLAVTELFLFGWSAGMDALTFVTRLSPVTLMIERFAIADGTLGASSPIRLFGPGRLPGANLALLVWLALGLLIFLAAVRVYRRRRTEVAETTSSRGALQALVKLAGTAVCGVTAGLIACSGSHGRTDFLLWTALIGALTYAVAEVVLNRGFKTLVRSLPLGAATVAGVVLVSLIPMTGAFGYESRVPAPEEVAAVEIGYTGRYAADISICRVEPGLPDNGGKAGRAVGYTNEVLLSAPEDLSAVEAFHRDVIAKRYRPYEGITLEPGEEYMHLGSTITYTLKNGRTLTRRYEGAGTGSIRLLAPLETSPDLLAQTHPAFFDRGQDVKKWRISDPFGAWTVEKAWPVADSQALLDAMRTDLLAQTVEDLLHPSDAPVAWVTFEADLPPEGAPRASTSGSFLVTESSLHTRAFLAEKGVLDEIAPDLDACYAVGVSGSGVRYLTTSDSAVLQVIPGRGEFTANDYDYLKENVEASRRYYAENPDVLAADFSPGEDVELDEWGNAVVQTQMAGASEVLFEDPADIAALAAAAVPSWDTTEPVVCANFWFRGATGGTPVLLPLSRLPEDLRQRIAYPYGVPGE